MYSLFRTHKKEKINLFKEQHRAARTTLAGQAKCKHSDGEAAPTLWRLECLLDREQERQEQRAEEAHAEGSANDMDVE